MRARRRRPHAGRGPLVWLGRRSYGVYLWHWPVLACLTNAAPGVAVSAPGRVVALVLPVALAALSYRLLEEPLLRLGPRRWAEAAAGRVRAAADRRPRAVLGVAAACAAVLAVACVGVSRAPSGGGLEAQIAAGRQAIAARRTALPRPAAAGRAASRARRRGAGRSAAPPSPPSATR